MVVEVLISKHLVGGGGGYSGGGGGLHGGGGGGNFLAAIQRGIIAKKSSNRGHGFAKILPLDKATLQKVLTLGGVPSALLSRVDKMSIAKEQGKILGGALSELERRKLKNMKMHREKYEAYLAEKQQDRKLQKKRRERRRKSDGSISLSNASNSSSVASKFGFPNEQRRGSIETIATVESLSAKLPKISGFDRTEEEKEAKLQLRSKERQWQLEDQQHEEQLEKDFEEGKIKKLPSAWEKRNAKRRASLNRKILGMPFNYLVTSLSRTHAQLRLPTSGFI